MEKNTLLFLCMYLMGYLYRKLELHSCFESHSQSKIRTCFQCDVLMLREFVTDLVTLLLSEKEAEPCFLFLPMFANLEN
jgi:hypothetical protein